MVDREFFVKEIDKLKQQFGDRFSQRKQDLIFLALRSLTNADVSKIFDKLIGDYRYAPTLAEIKELAANYNSKKFEYTDCNLCGGSGMVSLYYKKTGVNYAFSCDCKNGVLYPKLQKVKEINLNLFTRVSPRKLCLGGECNPYDGKFDT